MKTIWKWIDALARAVIGLIGKISPKLGKLCLGLWENTELVTYLFVGVATTIVNYVVYVIATRPLGISLLVSNALAWVAAVIFGYVANKKFVFKTHCPDMMSLVREAASFFAMRFVSLGMDMAIMWFTVDVLHFNDLVMKIASNIIVIIANYVFSKMFVFKKK